MFLDNNKEILQSINKVFLEECIIFFNAIKIFFTYSPEYSNTSSLFMPTQLFFRNDLFNKQELSFFQKILEILACDNSSCSYIANKIKTQSKHEKKINWIFPCVKDKKISFEVMNLEIYNSSLIFRDFFKNYCYYKNLAACETLNIFWIFEHSKFFAIL